MAVWTGSRMVRGGELNGTYLDTGGVYDPAAGTWTATTTVGAPARRAVHTAVWTGSHMVVWGGFVFVGGSTTPFDTGGIYFDPALIPPPPPPTDFYTVTPCRVADTRGPDGPTGGPILGGRTTRSFPVTSGTCGIPATALAVSVNLAAVGAAAGGYLTLYPGDAALPPIVSNVNFSAGQTRANNAIVPLAGDGTGTIRVKNGSASTVHFVLDVNGYFQ
jgi:hypothetical protein